MRGSLAGVASWDRRAAWTPRRSRVLGSLLAIVLLVSACGPRTEIVYVDRDEHGNSDYGASRPVGRTTDPRVHEDGAHEPSAEVAVGPGTDADRAAPSAPIASSGGPLVHANGVHHVASPVAIAQGRGNAASDTYTAPASTASSVASGHAASAPPTAAPAANPQAAARVAASPTPPTRLNLGASLGAVPGTSVSNAALDLTEDDELTTVAGRIESIVGKSVLVDTASGKSRVRLTDGARIERDALGSADDLKPGQFVGVLHAPSGPASSVRLYATGPSMPRPGVVPMVGSRIGQVTTFGSIVSLQFGGLLLNAGGQTTNVTLPSSVEILKPARSASDDLSAGAQIIATGPVNADGTLLATGVRVTGQPRPDR